MLLEDELRLEAGIVEHLRKQGYLTKEQADYALELLNERFKRQKGRVKK